ncbi:hypothetical protein GCM10010123_45770 [Pilimelia anulata]|uniref:Uncharacterized protein n=1 Tax=Pilimelia anulata TaxID=53371 RepID=A0A8J3BCB5_9ACTN|nr:hypothetical protein [Pilimelia anulata]GGK10614.1 hypothetical protein GCM10010123_45770 [Pilimelia anulata]
MVHHLSPTGVAALLLLALVVDYLDIGKGLGDRIAFCLGIVAIREGFDGSQIDSWTVGWLVAIIDALKKAAGDAYIAGATSLLVVGVLLSMLLLYCIGCMLPKRIGKKLGKFAEVELPKTGLYKINWKLWVLAAIFGLMSDLPQGWLGGALRWTLNQLGSIVSFLPSFLFGVN